MKILILIISSLFTLYIQAQTNYLTFCIEGGLNLATLRGNDIIDEYHNSKIGTTFGISIVYKINKTFSLQSGTYYELKGSSYDFEAQDQIGQPLGIVHGFFNLHYLTCPILIRASFGNKFNYSIISGPYIGFLLKQTTHVDAIKNLPEVNSNETKSYKKTELGLSLGIGLNYSISYKQALSIEARNNLGLINISTVPIIHNGTIKSNVFCFIVGYNYKLYKHNSNSIKYPNL